MATNSTYVDRPASAKSSKAPWRRLITASTDTGALSALQPAAAEPTAGSYRCSGWPSARFVFAGTDADGETVNYEVVGWVEYDREGTAFWMPTILAKGTYTLGATTAGAAGADIEASSALFANVIAEDAARPGVWVSPVNGDYIAQLAVDLQNSYYVQVRTDLATAATATVLLKLGDEAFSAATASVADFAIDLDVSPQSTQHVHTSATDGEEVAGDVAFDAGALIEATGIDTWIAIGKTEAQAEGNAIKRPAGVPFRFRLSSGAVTFWIDAATAGEVSVHQVGP